MFEMAGIISSLTGGSFVTRIASDAAGLPHSPVFTDSRYSLI